MNAEALRKILHLEQQKGYADSAVFGGLDKFLHNWSAKAVASVGNSRLLARFHKLLKASYGSMTPEQRRSWMQDVLGFLDDMESRDSATPLPAPGPQKPPPRKKSAPKVKQAPTPSGGSGLDSPVTVLKGISTSFSGKFGKLGVKTVRD
ncbi:MAG TPA: DNA helicase RecG, partial [Dehalococcoidales bacterium]|nr:DNA helicase RecG [Dehalococcoidales bacterium]